MVQMKTGSNIGGGGGGGVYIYIHLFSGTKSRKCELRHFNNQTEQKYFREFSFMIKKE